MNETPFYPLRLCTSASNYFMNNYFFGFRINLTAKSHPLSATLYLVLGLQQLIAIQLLDSPPLCPTVCRRVLAAMKGEMGETAVVPSSPDALSEQETAVLRLLCARLSNREIGDELFITPGTAKWHVHNILQKLGASNRTQAAVRTREFGLVN
jgi:DNA-binding NarL/FixJ family response regulator